MYYIDGCKAPLLIPSVLHYRRLWWNGWTAITIKNPIHNLGVRDIFKFFLNHKAEECKKNRSAWELSRTPPSSYPIIRPKETARSLPSRLYCGSTKGDPPAYFAEATAATRWNTKRNEGKRYGGRWGEKERVSQSTPCSRIMARTHCSNYSCIRLTSLSVEPAGRGTCVTNMRPHRHSCACVRMLVLVCVRVCVQERGKTRGRGRCTK